MTESKFFELKSTLLFLFKIISIETDYHIKRTASEMQGFDFSVLWEKGQM